ncbi:type II toxin-antitoxin system HicB family antitoxin [Trichocoleus sp. FACHB-591]|uniref:type II toxin-antitoxin system HicB family antitoxin n=1 Tax=Trichocoleus sp. FACHB-591 TaxID=2692872 RepID=UPI001F55324A|nr:type II toxin-antitoxin system HicB family antitoxin [Trichocoleus sp. FACHB-591]
MSQRDKLLVKILLVNSEAKMKIKYELIIYWSEVDQAFIAEVSELPGCTADGETYQEVVQNVEILIQEWIETAQELGRPIPEPKGRLLFA